jgi:hypothetical protein
MEFSSCAMEAGVRCGNLCSATEPSLLQSTIVPWRCHHGLSRVDATIDSLPLVVLPGFGNCTRDYECPFGDADDSIAAALRVSHDVETALETV